MIEPPSLHVLDVGHGNAAVLMDGFRVAVFDAGPKSGLLEFLRDMAVAEVDVVLISHADEDHIAGLLAVVAAGTCRIRRVRLNTDSAKESEIWNDLLYELDHRQRRGEIDFLPALTSAQSGEFDSPETVIQILGPSTFLAGKGPGSTDAAGRRITTNSISAVIRVLRAGGPVALFPGDIDRVGLDDLVRNGVQAAAPILVFPHHGGRVGSANDLRAFVAVLCAVVQPRSVIFSIARDRRYMNPLPEVVQELRRAAPGVHIACTQLSQRCSPEIPANSPRHLAPYFARGRQSGACCAGTIAFNLDRIEAGVPILAEHQAFIRISAPTALCQ